MAEARVVINKWLEGYNSIRLLGSLGRMSPKQSFYSNGLKARRFNNRNPCQREWTKALGLATVLRLG